jgi:hypothetical protein
LRERRVGFICSWRPITGRTRILRRRPARLEEIHEVVVRAAEADEEVGDVTGGADVVGQANDLRVRDQLPDALSTVTARFVVIETDEYVRDFRELLRPFVPEDAAATRRGNCREAA